jgi:hypothetical protein
MKMSAEPIANGKPYDDTKTSTNTNKYNDGDVDGNAERDRKR